MSKAGNWVPIDKGAIKTLGNIGRPYSIVEALFSHTVDVDCGKPWTINGYAKIWGWSRGKVRRFLDSLRTHSGHIADRKGTQSGHPVHLIDGSLWGEANMKRTHSEHIADNKRDTTIDPKPNPNPEVIKSTVEKPSVFNRDVGEIFSYWQAELNHPRAKLDDKRKKKIKGLLKIGYTVEDLKTAIDGCKKSPFHQGQNPRGSVFDDIELICRDASHVDKFIKTASLAGSATQLSEYGKRAVEVSKSWLESKNGSER